MSQESLQSKPNIQWFNAKYWQNENRLIGTYAGRGSVWVINADLGKWVLKHYYRGGLYAKLNRDKYLWNGLNKTRAIREFRLLQHMQDQGLPCPKPIAVRVKKMGLFYTNDLITCYIDHQTTFSQLIKQDKASVDLWARIGRVIARFHAAGIYHADLNANNLLINDDEIYLIDFDKGAMKANRNHWPQANLARLKRSIEKETKHSCERYFSEHWQALLTSHRKQMADNDH